MNVYFVKVLSGPRCLTPLIITLFQGKVLNIGAWMTQDEGYVTGFIDALNAIDPKLNIHDFVIENNVFYQSIDMLNTESVDLQLLAKLIGLI